MRRITLTAGYWLTECVSRVLWPIAWVHQTASNLSVQFWNSRVDLDKDAEEDEDFRIAQLRLDEIAENPDKLVTGTALELRLARAMKSRE